MNWRRSAPLRDSTREVGAREARTSPEAPPNAHRTRYEPSTHWGRRQSAFAATQRPSGEPSGSVVLEDAAPGCGAPWRRSGPLRPVWGGKLWFRRATLGLGSWLASQERSHPLEAGAGLHGVLQRLLEHVRCQRGQNGLGYFGREFVGVVGHRVSAFSPRCVKAQVARNRAVQGFGSPVAMVRQHAPSVARAPCQYKDKSPSEGRRLSSPEATIGSIARKIGRLRARGGVWRGVRSTTGGVR